MAAPLVSRIGVRWRSVLVAVVVVLLALLAGGSGLVYILQQNLEGAARSSATSRAFEVEGLIRSGGLAQASATIAAEARSGQFVQIIGPGGQVEGASSRLVSDAPLSAQRPPAGQNVVTEVDLDGLGVGGEWLVASRGVASQAGTYVVQVAIPIRVQRETVQTVAIFLLAATPVLLLGVAAAVWVLVGRALRAVEDIRTRVATIDDRRLAQRVEVPPTRDEVAALATTMNSMLDRLESSQRAQRAFVSDASHELRSPLATLTAAAELANRAEDPARSRLLITIAAELSRMRVLVENLMTLARADADDLLSTGEDVDLDDLVDLEVHRLRTTGDRQVIVTLGARADPG